MHLFSLLIRPEVSTQKTGSINSLLIHQDSSLHIDSSVAVRKTQGKQSTQVMSSGLRLRNFVIFGRRRKPRSHFMQPSNKVRHESSTTLGISLKT